MVTHMFIFLLVLKELSRFYRKQQNLSWKACLKWPLALAIVYQDLAVLVLYTNTKDLNSQICMMELYSIDTCMFRSRNTTMQYKEREKGGGGCIDLVDKDKLIKI